MGLFQDIPKMTDDTVGSKILSAFVSFYFCLSAYVFEWKLNWKVNCQFLSLKPVLAPNPKWKVTPNEIDSLISLPSMLLIWYSMLSKVFRSAWEIIGKRRRMTLELINSSTKINNSDQCHHALTKNTEHHSTAQEVSICKSKTLSNTQR